MPRAALLSIGARGRDLAVHAGGLFARVNAGPRFSVFVAVAGDLAVFWLRTKR
jgi:hypothetical protein